MEFEFDPGKSSANRGKHGIDFEDIQRIWLDPRALEVPARASGETRFLVIGRIEEKYWSAVVTYRSGRIRIISARRSRDEEVALYEGE